MTYLATLLLLIISDLAFAISFTFLKFCKCADEMFVITAISGFKIFERELISPFLFIPNSKTPKRSRSFKFDKLNGSPY